VSPLPFPKLDCAIDDEEVQNKGNRETHPVEECWRINDVKKLPCDIAAAVVILFIHRSVVDIL
jgi:hypothetical protein